MKNKVQLLFFICFFSIFFFCNAEKGKAIEVSVVEKPIASEINYGEPLFMSSLSGGIATVEGVFRWENQDVVLDAGNRTVSVVFDPSDNSLQEIVIDVDIMVNKRRVYIKFEKEIYKQYDETRNIELPNYIVGGIRQVDGVYVRGNLEGILESGLVSKEANVYLSGIELVGDKKDNYYLDLEGFKASVYPKYLERVVGDKNRIEFDSKTLVPINSLFYAEEKEVDFVKDGYQIKRVYDSYLVSDNKRVDVSGRVNVRIKIDENSFDYKRLKIFNYYNGTYEEITDYKYENGYFNYVSNGLGMVVFAQKELNFWWLYFLVFSIILVLGILVTVKLIKLRKKISKYKSVKRRRNNGDY